tara:strand:- start:443 stop:1339 length:897 start_codon:yes stop_codon:yes gene_type:complete
MPTLLVTGGSGFIGRHFCHAMMETEWTIIVLSRNIQLARKVLPIETRCIADLNELERNIQIDTVLNLAGESLAEGRWTRTRKLSIYESRVDFTTRLFKFFRNRGQAPNLLLSGSAIGFYGSGSESVDESGPWSDGFSHRLCAAWEQSAAQFEELGTRVIFIRTGIVLGELGALAKMLTPFKLGLGGPIGQGHQYMSWIHIKDMVNVLQFCLFDSSLHGPINATAPNAVTNKEFSRTLASILNRPAVIPLPEIMVKALFGEMGTELLLKGQRIYPKRILDAGFEYEFSHLRSALSNLLG